MSTVNYINHYQKSIEKNRNNSERLLHCLTQLFKLNGISVKHLQETGIGKTVNSLRKHEEPEVCLAAKTLVTKWKAMVAEESDEDTQVNENGNDNEDDDEDAEDPGMNGNGNGNDFGMKPPKESSSSEQDKHSTSRPEKSEPSSSKKESSSHHHHHQHQSSEKHESKKEKTSEKDSRKPHSDRNGHHHSHSSKSSSKDNKESSSHSEKISKSHKRSRSPADEDGRKSKAVKVEKESHSSKKESHKDRKKTSSSEDREKSHKSKESSSSSSKHHKHSSSSSSKSHSKSEKSEATSDLKEARSKEKETKQKSSKGSTSDEKDDNDIEFDCAGGMGFAEALAAFDVPRSSKKSAGSSSKKSADKKSSSQPSTSSASTSLSAKPSTSKSFRSSPEKRKTVESLTSPPKSLTQNVKLAPLPDISPEFPDVLAETVQISNDYRPMPMSSMMMDYVFSSNNKAPKKLMTDEELLTASFSSKANRTKVYSGNKTYREGVPKLFDLCIRVLQENIEFLEFTGGVPFDLLKPVLEKATPEQLNVLEYYNPYLVDESDILWEPHCKRKFRGKQPQEMESWRDMYLRCTDEQENKLRSLTEVIRRTKEQNTAAIKKSKIAYVDTAVKAPRNVLSKQIKFGTKHLAVTSPAARVSSLNVGINVAKAGDARTRVAAGIRDAAQTAVSNPMKIKRAPLMAKSLQLMKGRLFKR